MADSQGTPNAIGGSSIESKDVPTATGENVGGLIVGPAAKNLAYKNGGKVKESSKISTHAKNKSSPNW